jgi:hypothetical protein
MAAPMTSFTFETLLAELTSKIDFLTDVVLRASGYSPIVWAEEVLEEAEEADDGDVAR